MTGLPWLDALPAWAHLLLLLLTLAAWLLPLGYALFHPRGIRPVQAPRAGNSPRPASLE